MKQTTTWHPDTCDCIINYEWDDTDPPETRVHTPTGIVKKCAFHQGTSDIKGHYDSVLEENVRKNVAIKKIKETYPAADVKFSLDNNRDVTLDVKGVVIPDTNALAASIGTKVKVTAS